MTSFDHRVAMDLPGRVGEMRNDGSRMGQRLDRVEHGTQQLEKGAVNQENDWSRGYWPFGEARVKRGGRLGLGDEVEAKVDAVQRLDGTPGGG